MSGKSVSCKLCFAFHPPLAKVSSKFQRGQQVEVVRKYGRVGLGTITDITYWYAQKDKCHVVVYRVQFAQTGGPADFIMEDQLKPVAKT